MRIAATPKFEVKRHGVLGHSSDGIPVPLGGYSASNFAGSAVCQSHAEGIRPWCRARESRGVPVLLAQTGVVNLIDDPSQPLPRLA
jgi:hypothetical protein